MVFSNVLSDSLRWRWLFASPPSGLRQLLGLGQRRLVLIEKLQCAASLPTLAKQMACRKSPSPFCIQGRRDGKACRHLRGQQEQLQVLLRAKSAAARRASLRPGTELAFGSVSSMTRIGVRRLRQPIFQQRIAGFGGDRVILGDEASGRGRTAPRWLGARASSQLVRWRTRASRSAVRESREFEAVRCSRAELLARVAWRRFSASPDPGALHHDARWETLVRHGATPR